MNDQEAKTIARQVIEKCQFPAFATVDENGCPQMRSMMPVKVDEDFTVYYITSRLSAKCAQIAACANVSTLWWDVVEPMRDWRSVLVKSVARITDDRVLREKFWMEPLRAVFPGGVDDPSFVIIVAKPTELIFAAADVMPPVVVRS